MNFLKGSHRVSRLENVMQNSLFQAPRQLGPLN